jgi:EmrB/QacA subfamily drug resistance transporter
VSDRAHAAGLGSYRATFAALAFGVGSFALLQSSTVTALPHIQRELGASQATASWILTAFLVSASVATPIAGRLGDARGKRAVLIGSLLLLAIGSLLAAVSSNMDLMIVARVIQGASGGVVPLAFGILRDEVPEDHLHAAIGVTSSLLAAGFGLGIVVAGPIVESLGFHWLFLMSSFPAAIAIAGVLALIPNSRVKSRERIPALPAVLMAGWLICLLFGVTQAPVWGWASTGVLALFVAGVLLLVMWFESERRAPVPLIDLRMMRLRGVWTTNLVALLIGVTMYGSFGFFPQFNQTPASAGYGFGVSATEAGYMMLPTAVLSFLCGTFSGRLSRAIGTRRVIVLGCFINAAGLFFVAFAHHEKWHMYAAAAVTGLGTGLCFAALPNAVMDAVKSAQTGVATGMNANIRTIGGSLGSAVMTSLVAAEVSSSGYATEAAYVVGFVFLGGAAVLAGAAGFMTPGRKKVASGAQRRPDVLITEEGVVT